MAEQLPVSLQVIRRLPRYYRFLGELLNSGVIRISSMELAEQMGLTASQIRQDFNSFGGFGQRGYGYNVISLRNEIKQILGIDTEKKIIQIGFGNLGRALTAYLDFNACGFELVGLFEKDPTLIGQKFRSHMILSIEQLLPFCKKHHPTTAILCISKQSAKQLSRVLIESGITSFWNFSHYDFQLNYDNVVVENVRLTDSLMTLGYLAH